LINTTTAGDALLAILASLHAARIVLRIDDGQLRFRAPRGAMTAALADAVKANRQALIDHLTDGTGWPVALSAADAAIDNDLAEGRLSPTQRNVLELFRVVARKHHDNQDAALFTWADEVRYQMTCIWGQSPASNLPSSGDSPP
jgi:hypothetical protein